MTGSGEAALLALLVASLGGCATTVPPRQTLVRAPWQERGAQVERQERSYHDRLDRLYASLKAAVAADAPDLLPRLKAAPPKPVRQGYQLLPRLVADEPPPASPPRARVAAYSWPWTETMIRREAERLGALEDELARARALPPGGRAEAYEKLVTDWLPAPKQQRLIQAHLRYNQLWQGEIAARRGEYDRQTTLEEAVLERQAIRDALAAEDLVAFRRAVVALPRARGEGALDPARPRPELEDELRQREERLASAVHQASGAVAPRSFLRLEQEGEHRRVLRVPVATDVEDGEFLEAFRAAVERVWRVRDGDDELRVEVTLRRLAPAELYAASGGAAPRRGEAIDVNRHCGRFPRDAASLTTGAATTHVAAGTCIALGPNDLAPHVLAHEFGHLLGLRDVYFRGYADLGPDGFEVREVVADPDDIMGAPGSGPVLRRHFEAIAKASEPAAGAR